MRDANGMSTIYQVLVSALMVLIAFASTDVVAMDVTDDEYVIFYHNDALGSPVQVSDHQGRVLWFENSTPYGDGLGRVSSSGLGSGDNLVEEATSRPGFTGHTQDTSTGLVYMKARHYDPVIGRFYSNDPVGFYAARPTSFNRYAYAGNNPYRYVDPNGEDFLDAYRNPSNAMAASNFGARNFGRTSRNPVGALLSAVYYGSSTLTGYALHKASVYLSEEADDEPSSDQDATKLDEARAARDELSESAAKLSNKKRPATVTAGYNIDTGEVSAAASCGDGICAEDHVVDALGGNKEKVRFTEAVRPRNDDQVPICITCEGNYGRDSFPSGTTRFKSDEL